MNQFEPIADAIYPASLKSIRIFKNHYVLVYSVSEDGSETDNKDIFYVEKSPSAKFIQINIERRNLVDIEDGVIVRVYPVHRK